MLKTLTIAVLTCFIALGLAKLADRQAPAAPVSHDSPEMLAAAAATLFHTPATASQAGALESSDAVDCYAGGWQPVVSGWGPRCCGTSVRRWIKFGSGTTTYFKCCGACPQ